MEITTPTEEKTGRKTQGSTAIAPLELQDRQIQIVTTNNQDDIMPMPNEEIDIFSPIDHVNTIPTSSEKNSKEQKISKFIDTLSDTLQYARFYSFQIGTWCTEKDSNGVIRRTTDGVKKIGWTKDYKGSYYFDIDVDMLIDEYLDPLQAAAASRSVSQSFKSVTNRKESIRNTKKISQYTGNKHIDDYQTGTILTFSPIEETTPESATLVIVGEIWPDGRGRPGLESIYIQTTPETVSMFNELLIDANAQETSEIITSILENIMLIKNADHMVYPKFRVLGVLNPHSKDNNIFKKVRRKLHNKSRINNFHTIYKVTSDGKVIRTGY